MRFPVSVRHLLLCCALACAPWAARAAPQPAFENTMAQRVLACTSCHGKEGRAGPDGYYPRIAGKPASYLYNQLLNFREGRRQYAPMTRLLEPLSDAYLMEIAEHFAVLRVPYPPSPASAQPPELLLRGRLIAQKGDASRELPACAQCHGRTLTGMLPQVPGLLGLPRDYLNAQLGAWRTGQRRAHAPDCMAEIARKLTPDDLSAVTAWLAAQPVPGAARPMPAPRKPTAAAASTPACGSAPPPVAARP